MSGFFLLDWASLAVSLFNTMILLWLGLAIMLNAERRSIGLWFSSGMLLLGSVFFLSHSAILGIGPGWISPGLNFWWHLGWFPVVFLPLAWYGVTLWYCGFWSQPQSELHSRHQVWFAIVLIASLVITIMLFLANPLPTFYQFAPISLKETPTIAGIPLLLIVYLVYILACISFALEALSRPARSERMMGDLARLRARPWLISATFLEILVCLLVGWVVVVVLHNAEQTANISGVSLTIARFDLAIASLIAVAVTLLGQAVVSYEVFTGKTAPSRGLKQYWQGAFVISAIYAFFLSWSLTLALKPIYIALLGALGIAFIFALLSWKSFAEREHAIQNLRPFVASQRLVDHLSASTEQNQIEDDALLPFYALCENFLGTNMAILVPAKSVAPLVSSPLIYPPGSIENIPTAFDLDLWGIPAHELCSQVDPRLASGASWAVPLWGERGQVGMLMLGSKKDGSLFTQEEIEIARVTGERTIDILAGAELTRRLLNLQRQRLAESQVLDRQSRRIIHDEVLPELHAAMLELGSILPPTNEKNDSLLISLSSVHRKLSDLIHGATTHTVYSQANNDLINGLHQVISGEFLNEFEKVIWQISPEAQSYLSSLPAMTSEVLFYAAREVIRNATRHARHPKKNSPLQLEITANYQDDLKLTIQDNGKGLFFFERKEEGGQGLLLHSTLMAVIGGTLEIDSIPDAYTRVTLRLPG
jgi:signal transduction histidine kinase